MVDSADAPLYLPYKALVSTISSMVFSEGEAHRLIEILSEKVGIIQDTWHMVMDAAVSKKKRLHSSLNMYETCREIHFFCCLTQLMCFQATQKGDPVAVLKKQLEEREKQLAAEQEDASAAKNRLRELTKVRHTRVSQVNEAVLQLQHLFWSVTMLAAL